MGFRCFLEAIQERPVGNLLPHLVDRRGLSKSLIIHSLIIPSRKKKFDTLALPFLVSRKKKV